MFSNACEYGIRAMIWISSNDRSSTPVQSSLKEICAQVNLPEAFTGKVLQTLKKAGLLHSAKGPQGGYKLSRSADDINLYEIVFAIDGNRLFTRCSMGLPDCSSETPCPIHNEFMEIKGKIKNVLLNTSLSNTTEGILQGLTVIKK